MSANIFKVKRNYLHNVDGNKKTPTRGSFFDSSTFKIYKFMTHFVYQWPFQKWTQIFLVMSIEIPVNTIIVWGQLAHVYSLRNQKDEIIINSLWPVPHFYIYIINVNALMNRKITRKYFQEMKADYQTDCIEDYNVLKPFGDNSKKFINLIIITYILFLAPWLSVPLLALYLNRNKTLDIHSDLYFVFDINLEYLSRSLSLKFFAYFYGVIACAFNYATFSNTCIIFFFHLFGKCAVLKSRIENIGKDGCFHLGTDIIRDIKNCAKIHRKLLEYLNILQKWGQLLLFVGVIINIFVISLALYTIKVNTSTFTVMKYSSLYMFIIFSMLVLCIFGERVLNINVQIKQSCYDSNWRSIPKPATKILNMIQCRCNHNLGIHAYNLILLSMHYYVKVAQTAFTYFTLLCSMTNK